MYTERLKMKDEFYLNFAVEDLDPSSFDFRDHVFCDILLQQDKN